MKEIKLTHDECYQMERLYETILDLDLELNPLCENVFDKILSSNSNRVALSTMNTDNLPDISDNEAEGITE